MEEKLVQIENKRLDSVKKVKIKAMPASQLEDLIKQSKGSLSCFIDEEGSGVLTSMIKSLATSNIYGVQRRIFLPGIKPQ